MQAYLVPFWIKIAGIFGPYHNQNCRHNWSSPILKNTFCFSWISSSVAFLTKFRCIVVLIIPINWVPRQAQASSFALTAVTRLFELSIYGNILEINHRYVDIRRTKMDQNVYHGSTSCIQKTYWALKASSSSFCKIFSILSSGAPSAGSWRSLSSE